MCCGLRIIVTVEMNKMYKQCSNVNNKIGIVNAAKPVQIGYDVSEGT